MSIRILSLIVACLWMSGAHAGLMKWVDENGQVHYGDRIPPQYLKKEHETLNEQGVVIHTTNRTKTKEELKEEEKEQRRLAAEQKAKMIERRKAELRDRVLLDTFTTEEDIVHARDERVAAIDSQINLAETIIKDQTKKLEKVKGRIDKIEKSGRKVPDNLYKEVDSVGRQLETYYQNVETRQQERQHILEKFDEDITRFRELMAIKKEQQKNREDE